MLVLSSVGAGACPNLIDCAGSGNKSGVWSIAPSPAFPAVYIGLTAAGALWEGSDSRLGKTLWQMLDASVITGVVTTGMKYSFQRARPTESDTPDRWFAGTHHQSFPSGDVSSIAALTVPLIAEYRNDHPAIWALAALPIFDAEARVRYRAHWPTDVIAGAAVGVAGGLVARIPKTPVFVSVMPGFVTVGLRKRF
jgi:undecaprenyl-diphosphatase